MAIVKSWIVDSALLELLAMPGAAILRRWCADNRPQLYLFTASLTDIAQAIAKSRVPSRAAAQRKSVEDIKARFSDRMLSI